MNSIRLLLFLGIFIPLAYGDPETAATLLYPRSEIVLSASIQGTLESILVHEGDEVAQGAVLAKIESADEELLIERLEKVIEKRRFDSEGFKQLLAKHMASETDAMQARLDLEIAVIDLKNARQKLSQKRLVAPTNGVITHLAKEVGEWVQAGDKVVEIIDVDEVHAVFFLPFAQARSLRVGQTVDVLVPQVQSAPVVGRIFFIAPGLDASSGLITLKAAIDNRSRRFRPGLAGTVRLPPPSRDAALLPR